ncbi:TPA: hypothetical protein ACOEHG_005122 [Enterobacter ludwigii]
MALSQLLQCAIREVLDIHHRDMRNTPGENGAEHLINMAMLHRRAIQLYRLAILLADRKNYYRELKRGASTEDLLRDFLRPDISPAQSNAALFPCDFVPEVSNWRVIQTRSDYLNPDDYQYAQGDLSHCAVALFLDPQCRPESLHLPDVPASAIQWIPLLLEAEKALTAEK